MVNEKVKTVSTQNEDATSANQDVTMVMSKMQKALRIKPVSEFKPDYGMIKKRCHSWQIKPRI